MNKKTLTLTRDSWLFFLKINGCRVIHRFASLIVSQGNHLSFLLKPIA